MSDTPEAPRKPATRPITRGVRPATRPVTRAVQAVPPPASNSKLRLLLMIGIIGSIVVLVPIVGWRVWVVLHTKPPEEINVADRWQAAYEPAEKTSRDVFAIESKVWMKDETLAPGDLEALKGKLKELEAANETLEGLISLLHKKRLTDSQEMVDILARWLKVKFWIFDLYDVLHSTAPDWKGFNIPMNAAMRKSQAATAALKEVEATREALLKKGDKAEIADALQKVTQCQDTLAAAIEKLNGLEEYLEKGLAQGPLTPKDIKELGILRDEVSTATQAVKQARELRSQLKQP